MTQTDGTLTSIKGRLLRINSKTGQLVKNDNSGNGAPNGATIRAAEYGDDVVHRTILTCTATPITVADDAGVAQYGGVKVYDFPAGLIMTRGAIVSGVIGITSGTIIATWSGVVALGSVVATTGATLVSTEATWLQSVAIGAATDGVGTIDAVSVAAALTESGARWFDGTATAADMFLNLAIADDATHTAAEMYFTGTIKFGWENFGDN